VVLVVILYGTVGCSARPSARTVYRINKLSALVSGIDIRDTQSKVVSAHADFFGWLETY